MLAGLHQLGWITMMMIPPDPGSSLPLYLTALGETLSIALLGTTLAALFALPVSLLAAQQHRAVRLSFAFRCAAFSIRSAASIR